MRQITLLVLASLILVFNANADELGTPGEVAKTGHQLTSPQQVPRQWWQSVTEPVKDIAQIAFWFTISIVTVLTYRRARKTLLQPIRTEVFKLQVEEVKQLFKIVIGKGETELRQYFGFEEIIQMNAIALLDDYARIRLGKEINYEKRAYMRTTEKIFNMEGSGVEMHFIETPSIPPELLTEIMDIRTPEQRWQEYRYEVIHLVSAYIKRCKRIEQFIDSPMLPAECVELVRALRNNLHKNVQLIFSVLTETAAELPKHFPTEKEMSHGNILWISNRYSGVFLPLKPDADRIVAFIRSHFGVDQLLKDD